MKTKIALPTDDGFIIGCECRYCRGFFIATVSDGRIMHEEIRWNLLSEILTSDLGFFYNLADCCAVILKDNSSGLGTSLAAAGKKVCYTNENLISQALRNYVQAKPAVSV